VRSVAACDSLMRVATGMKSVSLYRHNVPVALRCSLSRCLKRNPVIQEHMARCVILRLLLTVRRLHAAGILHLDLKLENVAVDENFGVRILDFGLARYVSSAGDAVHRMCIVWLVRTKEVRTATPTVRLLTDQSHAFACFLPLPRMSVSRPIRVPVPWAQTDARPQAGEVGWWDCRVLPADGAWSEREERRVRAGCDPPVPADRLP
jgi:serine/threonine protein kinase